MFSIIMTSATLQSMLSCCADILDVHQCMMSTFLLLCFMTCVYNVNWLVLYCLVFGGITRALLTIMTILR